MQYKPICVKKTKWCNTLKLGNPQQRLFELLHIFLFILNYHLKNVNQGYVFSLLLQQQGRLVQLSLCIRNTVRPSCNRIVSKHPTHAVLSQRFVLKRLVSEKLCREVEPE